MEKMMYLEDLKSTRNCLENLVITNSHIKAVAVSIGTEGVMVENELAAKSPDGWVDDEHMSDLERAKKSRMRITKETSENPVSFGRERGEPIAEIMVAHEHGEHFSVYLHHHKGSIYFKVVSHEPPEGYDEPDFGKC